MRDRRTPITMVALAGLILAACGDDGTAEQLADPPPAAEPADDETARAPSSEPGVTTTESPTTPATTIARPTTTVHRPPIVADPDLPGLVVFTVDDGLPTDQVSHVDVGTDGTVWVITEGEPVRDTWPRYESYAWFDGSGFVDIGSPDLLALDDPENVHAEGVFGMDASGGPNRTLWVANTGWDSTGDAYHFDGSEWSSPIERSAGPSRGRAAPDGSLWMIPMSSALVRVDANGMSYMPAPEGGIPCVFCVEYEFDGDGVLWMATEHGLSSYDGEAWTSVDAEFPGLGTGGLGVDEGSWTLGADDSHWFLNNVGSLEGDEFVLSRYGDDEVVTLPIVLSEPAADKECIAEWFDVDVSEVTDTAIAEHPGTFSTSFEGFAGDATGDVWLALKCSGVYRIDMETGDDVRYGLEDGLPSLDLRGVTAHPDGSVWVATDDGVVRLDPTM